MNPRGRYFLLSPANCGGIRAGYLMREGASFDLARAVQSPRGAPLADVFTFMSGLYFRGKIAYARAFAADAARILVITPSEGLLPPDTLVDLARLRAFGTVDLEHAGDAFTRPLLRDAERIAREDAAAEVVLLGSIASKKYVEVLTGVFGPRLLFPSAFVGRGDMSRGGLMLRSAADRTELEYIPVEGATRRGTRPPKLTPRRYAKSGP